MSECVCAIKVLCSLQCSEEKVSKVETLRKANRESERERRGVSHYTVEDSIRKHLDTLYST